MKEKLTIYENNGRTFLFREDDTIVLRAVDVAKYIIDRTGMIDIWKLQKLVYYSQAWTLVWFNRPLFYEPIEAWANGPVCPILHEYLKEYYEVNSDTPIWDDSYIYDPEVSLDDWEAIEIVVRDYGDKSSMWLRELTQLEDPWKKARGNTPDMEHCNNEITHEMMRCYYGSL